jgi:sulfotransferase famil protein
MRVLISHSHRFIFVHISKTAGTSLKRTLAPYCHQPPRTGLRRLLSHLPVQESPGEVAFRAHTTARWARMKISPRVFDSYTAFSVVRNPFDRAVSNYHFLLQRPEHHSHRHVRQMTFDEYLKFLKGRRWMRDPTQRYRVIDSHGRLLCTPILRFESLQADFANLCGKLGLEVAPSLGHRNPSAHRPFHEYYERRATRDAVVDLFAADFDSFGYPAEL